MISFIVFLTALIFAWIAILFSRSFIREADIEQALNTISEYRKTVEEAASRPRVKKKLRILYKEYKKARNFLLFSSLKKMVLLIIAYSISSMVIMVTIGTTIMSPIYVPGITIISNGLYYVPSVFVHFLGYIYAFVLFRKDLII